MVGGESEPHEALQPKFQKGSARDQVISKSGPVHLWGQALLKSWAIYLVH